MSIPNAVIAAYLVTAGDEAKDLTQRFRAMGDAGNAFAAAVKVAAAEKRLSAEQATQLANSLAAWGTLLVQRVNSWVSTQDEAAAKAGLRQSIADLKQIGDGFSKNSGLPNPVTTEHVNTVAPPEAPTFGGTVLKWTLLIAGGVLAYKYLWNRAGRVEYPRGQLPRYAGGQRGDD